MPGNNCHEKEFLESTKFPAFVKYQIDIICSKMVICIYPLFYPRVKVFCQPIVGLVQAGCPSSCIETLDRQQHSEVQIHS